MWGVIFLGLIFILIVFLAAKGGVNNLKCFRIQKTKDDAAYPVYAELEFCDDKLVIDKSDYILYENIERAIVSSSMETIKIVNAPRHAMGRSYTRKVVYTLTIHYKSKLGRQWLFFGSMKQIDYRKYCIIAQKINRIAGYEPPKENNDLREL